MPAFILTFLAKRIGARWAPVIAKLGLAVLAALLIALIVWRIDARGYARGKADANRIWNAAVEKVVAERIRTGIEAARRDDAIRRGGEAAINERRKEIDDANATLPDQGLTDRQRSRACAELRRQGRDCR